MSKLFKATMIAILGCLAFSAAASATGVTIGASDPTNFTATTSGLQTLATTVLGIIPTTITCLQTLTLTVRTGTFQQGALPIGQVTAAAFRCNPDPFNVYTVTPLNLPWDIGLNSIVLSSPKTILGIVLNAQISVRTPNATCLFNGPIGFSITSGSSVGVLLGSTSFRSNNNPPCSNGTVSRATYAVSPRPTFS